jgi:uncharacterized protein YndB with AHSA1/START domain
MAASSASAKVTLPADDQILITREFDAPRHLVYRAYTEPDLIRRWWAGRRGEVTSVEVDLRVGGRWRYVMTAAGGYEVAFHGEFQEIVPDERLVTTEMYETPGASDEGAPVNEVTFTEAAGRTTLTILTYCHGRELRDMIIGSGMETGMQEGMDLMEEVARSLS